MLGFSMRNNFTSRVQKVIRFSKEEAMRLGHDYIGTEHLLLGILKEGEGIAVKILKNLNLDLEKLKQRLEEASGPAGGMMTLGNLPLSNTGLSPSLAPVSTGILLAV